MDDYSKLMKTGEHVPCKLSSELGLGNEQVFEVGQSSCAVGLDSRKQIYSGTYYGQRKVITRV